MMRPSRRVSKVHVSSSSTWTKTNTAITPSRDRDRDREKSTTSKPKPTMTRAPSPAAPAPTTGKVIKKTSISSSNDHDHGLTRNKDSARLELLTCTDKLEKSFKKLFCCSICKKEWSQPMGLPCGHVFCDDCLKNNQPSTSSASAGTRSSSTLIPSRSCETCQTRLGRRSVIVPRTDLETLSKLIKRLLGPAKPDEKDETRRKKATSLIGLEQADASLPCTLMGTTADTRSLMPPPPAPAAIVSDNSVVITDLSHLSPPEEASSPSNEKENIYDGVHVKDAQARLHSSLDELAAQEQSQHDELDPNPRDINEDELDEPMDEIVGSGGAEPKSQDKRDYKQSRSTKNNGSIEEKIETPRVSEPETKVEKFQGDSGVLAVTTVPKPRHASSQEKCPCKRQKRNSFAQTDNSLPQEPDLMLVEARAVGEGGKQADLLKTGSPMRAHFQVCVPDEHEHIGIGLSSSISKTMDRPVDLSMPKTVSTMRGFPHGRTLSALSFIGPLDLSINGNAKTQNRVLFHDGKKKILNPARGTTIITEAPGISNVEKSSSGGIAPGKFASYVQKAVESCTHADTLDRMAAQAGLSSSGVTKAIFSGENGKKVPFESQSSSDAFLGAYAYSPKSQKTPPRQLSNYKNGLSSQNSKKRPLTIEEGESEDGKKRLAVDKDRKNGNSGLHIDNNGVVDNDVEFLGEFDECDDHSNGAVLGQEPKILEVEPPRQSLSQTTCADSEQMKMIIMHLPDETGVPPKCIMSSTPKSKNSLKRHPTAELFGDVDDHNDSLESIEKEMLNFNTMAMLGDRRGHDDLSSSPPKKVPSDDFRGVVGWPEHDEDSESESDFLVATPNPKSQSILSAAPTSVPRNAIETTPSQILKQMDEDYEKAKKLKLGSGIPNYPNPIDFELDEFISPSVTNATRKDKPQLQGDTLKHGVDMGVKITNRATPIVKPKSSHLVFCPTRLSSNQEFELRRLCDITGSTFQRNYTGEVTHLIVELVNGRVPHTMKYFSAIADKKWILTYAWATESLKKGELISEELFETARFPNCDRGPKISRLSSGYLFRNVTFFVGHKFSQSGISAADCKNLLVMFGGKVVEDPSKATEDIVLIADPLDRSFDYNKWYLRKGWLTVTWEWVTDCVLSYSILPFTETGLLNRDLDISRIRLPAGISDDVYTQIDY